MQYNEQAPEQGVQRKVHSDQELAPRVSANIIDLTHASPSEFEEKIHSQPTMIKFYAPWCGACHKVAPMWNRLADSPPEGVQVVDVDATVNLAQAKRFDVKAYPTIKLLKDGLMYEYRGRWHYRDFYAFAEESGNEEFDKSTTEATSDDTSSPTNMTKTSTDPATANTRERDHSHSRSMYETEEHRYGH